MRGYMVLSTKKRLRFLAPILFLALALFAAAQDTNYWTLQYGLRGELLNGVAVGSLLDMSNTYYNPGGWALIENPSTLTTAIAIDYNVWTVEDGAGKDLDLLTTNANTLPSLVAFTLYAKPTSKHRVAFSALGRQQMDIRAKRQYIQPYASLPDGSPGDAVAGEWFTDSEIFEAWFGPTWAYRVNDRIGIGISQYFAVRSQWSRFQTAIQGYSSKGQGGSGILIDDLTYVHYRILAKIGICFDFSPWTFGMTLTTPGLKLFSEGEAFVNIFASAPGIDGEGGSLLASTAQKGLAITYKSPLSVAAGISYHVGSTRFHLSAEWFDAVDRFKLMDLDNFPAQSSGKPVDADYYHQLDEVINFGAGIEQRLSESLVFYGSFAIDSSAYSEGSHISVTSQDIYHFTVGSAFSVFGQDLTLGVGYSWGSGTVIQVADLTRPDLTGLAPELGENRTLVYSRIKFVIGIAL